MTRSPIAAAVERHSLAEVAHRTGIALDASTGTVTVRCPLPSHGHPDRTPSMRLYLDDGHYYCFGCGAKGDVVQWVRDTEDVGVAEAIRLLDSDRPFSNAWAGVSPAIRSKRLDQNTTAAGEAIGQAELPELDRTPPDRVRAALQAAWSYYTYRPLHARGAAYLSERRIDIGVLEAYTGRAEVGHTPAKCNGLVTALQVRGFSEDELVDAGLAYRRQGTDRMSDFYRERVLIPVRNHHGELCGLIGRNTGDVRWSKYKNPPRTHAYDKSVNLYQPLPPSRRLDGLVIVVEGTIDAMAIAVAAIQARQSHRLCPVTQSGRELSSLQQQKVRGMTHRPVVIAFDADAAGRESTSRLVRALALQGKRVSIAKFPEGDDPASWLAKRGIRGLALFSQATTVSEYQCDLAVVGNQRWGSTAEEVCDARLGN
jgi:DNA primase